MVSFEKVPGHNFFTFTEDLYILMVCFYANHLFAVHVMRIVNKQCGSFS